MTEKEAIYILRNAAWLGSDADRQKVEEAVEVVANAIEALNHSEIPNSFGKDTNVPSKDTIYRQDAIDVAKAHWYKPDIAGAIEQLPSAQPEPQRTFVELVVEYPEPELCAYKEYKVKPYYSIKYIENGETYVGYGTYNPKVLSRYLSEYFISSAQPRKKGRWIRYAECDCLKCDQCGMPSINAQNFCSKCGVDMRGKTMGRLLDEDDVIDAFAKLLTERCGGNRIWWKPVAEAIANNLPSAQQEPKSPLYYGDGYSEGKMVYDSAECPNCGYIYDEGDQVWGEPYCPHCGQALDWYMRGEQDG